MRFRSILLALLLALPSFGALLSVCSSGCTGTDLQAVYNAASCGDVIEQAAGYTVTESGSFSINKNCGANYILIRSSKAYALPAGRVCVNHYPNCTDDVANMALLRTSNSTGPVISVTASSGGVIFRGFDIGASPGQDMYSIVQLAVALGGYDGAVQYTQLPRNIIFDQDFVHSNNASNMNQNYCIEANTGYLEITNSFLFGYSPQSNGGSQSVCIEGYNTQGPAVIRNNLITDSQSGSQFGGATPSIAGLRVNAASFLGNYYYRPWYMRVTTGTTNPTGTCLYDTNGGESYNQTASGHWWLCSSGTWTDQGTGTSPQVATWDKNQWELKNAQNVIADGNIFSGGWYPTSLNQQGACALVNQVDNYPSAGTNEPEAIVTNVIIRNNICQHAPSFFVEGQLGSYYYLPSNIYVTNNLGIDIAASPQSVSNGLEPVDLEATAFATENFLTHSITNNTMILNPGSAGAQGTSMYIVNGPCVNCTFAGNIINFSGNGFGNDIGGGFSCVTFSNYDQTDPSQGWDMASRSIGLNILPNDQGLTYAGYSLGVIQFQASYQPSNSCQQQVGNPPLTGPSNFLPSSWAAVDFINFQAGGGGDYHLQSASPYHSAGPYGQDPGADMDIVNWSTANVLTGVPNPYLDFQILALSWTTTTASLRFLAYDNTACTVNVYNNPNRTSATFTETDSGGDRDRTASITGLTTQTRFWYDVLCAFPYRRSGIFITQ